MPATPLSRRKVAIIDDHPTIRVGLAARISIEHDLVVCGEADSIPSALQMIERTKPDIAVVDVSLREGSGIDLIRRLISHQFSTRILVWSIYGESLYADRAFRAGAMGYITKDAATDTIIEAIRCVLDGRVYASPELTQQLLVRNTTSSPAASNSPLELLSDRELEVFRLIGDGETTADIARCLKLSANTVETYRSRIRQKLNLDNAAQLHRAATQWVLENG
ncbi:MAG: response regulator transcription factor [Rhodopirellula sp.]|nr:response regulator transcription factor [Rhodopirellula sp.]